MNVKKQLGEKIKRIRKSKNITQEQLAEMIDISSRNLSGIELGNYFVKAETLEKILKALDVTTEELFSNDHLKEKSELLKEINIYLKKFNQSKVEYIYKMVKYLNFE